MFEPAPLPKEDLGAQAPRHDRIVASKSTVTGFDRRKQPFEINAASAVQDPDHDELVHMEQVSGRINKTNGEQVDLLADKADYNSSGKLLELRGNVRLTSNTGFVARMDSANVTLADKRLSTDVPVVVEFDAGRIEASGMQISDDGRMITFVNRVVAKFHGRASRSDRKQ